MPGNDRGGPRQEAAATSDPTNNTSVNDTGTVVNTTGTEVYVASHVKRVRRTNVALNVVNDAIVTAVNVEHPISVRGLYYRVVSAGAVDKTDPAYQLVSRQLVKLRANGVVPYEHITDGTRMMRKPRSYDDLDQMLEDAAASYRRALWNDQPNEVIILSEKDAISGSVWPVTAAWDVELGITRGYSSVTFSYSIAQTVLHNTANYKTTRIYQIGDHDPSGVDAWRSLQATVREFAPRGDVEFERLAVTEEQIYEFGLPTRPTKSSDTRAKGFRGESVEVDAIPPTVLRRIVEAAITRHIDPEALRLTQIAEQSERDILTAIRGGAE